MVRALDKNGWRPTIKKSVGSDTAGKKAMGRPSKWNEGIKNILTDVCWRGCKQANRMARDRKKWRVIIHPYPYGRRGYRISKKVSTTVITEQFYVWYFYVAHIALCILSLLCYNLMYCISYVLLLRLFFRCNFGRVPSILCYARWLLLIIVYSNTKNTY